MVLSDTLDFPASRRKSDVSPSAQAYRLRPGTFKISDLVQRIENDGHSVLYVSIKEKDWQQALGDPIDRAIIAGGDGSVSRIAPWLAARALPFCVLPLGTANNCAREGARISLGTDAHHPSQLAFMEFALAAALLAGFQKDRILNFMSVQELKRWSSK